jgi:ABC-type multidrug transport system fused ATPase/permease subunit
VNPVAGIAFAKILSLLSVPVEYLEFLDPEKKGGFPYMKKEIIYWSIVMLILGGITLVSFTFTKKVFGTLGNNVTLRVRKVLYGKILEKHIGFFDHPQNGTSVLTSAMASDTHIINGVGSDSIKPQVEALFNLFGGIAIGFYFCWQEALLCLIVSPVLAIGEVFNTKSQSGLTNESSDDGKV